VSIDDEIIEDFIIESEENLEVLDDCLMAIENGEEPDVDAIFRAMHSVKSAAAFLEIESLEKIAHSAETSLSFVRDRGRELQRIDVDLLIQSTGVAREILEAFKDKIQFDDSTIGELLTALTDMEERMDSGVDLDDSSAADSSTVPSPIEGADSQDKEHVVDPSDTLSESVNETMVNETINDESVVDVVSSASKLTPPKIKSRPVRKVLRAPEPVLESVVPEQDELGENEPTLVTKDFVSQQLSEELSESKPEVLSAPQRLSAPSAKLASPSKNTDDVAANEVLSEEDVSKHRESVDSSVSTGIKDPAVKSAPKIKSRPVRKASREPSVQSAEHHKVDTKVNVSIELLDEIINLVGELVVARNQIIRHIEEHEMDTIKKMVLPISHLTTDIQEKVMKTRMRQIGSAWGRYPRMIRDLGREINKMVELKMVGQETELDRSLLTMLQEPMRHMLRNAVDHGLESTDDRIRAGKAAAGTVWLKAYQASGQVVIEISDDGRGLDPEQIAEKAIRKGLITASRADVMSEEEIQKLIFAPGFSTKEAVTTISGRGVGMDVVQTMVNKVSGIIEIDSTLGQGSTFRIRVPLTLAILPALIVRTSENYFAVPQDNLLEIIDLRDGQENLDVLGGATVYSLRGNLLPLVGLSDLTGQSKTGFTQGYILVIQVNALKFGLVVENILDTEEIVVKPLGKELQGLNLFSGVTIHGNGKIAWIVDAASVALKAQIDDTLTALSQTEESDDYEDMQSMLRFEVNGVGSIAVDILSVIRVEQVEVSRIGVHNRRYIYTFNNEVIPVFTFGLEHINATVVSLIIIDDGNTKIALLAHEIKDVCRQMINPSPLLKEPWSIGMSMVDDVPTAIIALDSIVECVL